MGGYLTWYDVIIALNIMRLFLYAQPPLFTEERRRVRCASNVTWQTCEDLETDAWFLLCVNHMIYIYGNVGTGQITRSGEYRVLKVARGDFERPRHWLAERPKRSKQNNTYSSLAPWPVDFLHPLPRIGRLGTLHNRCTHLHVEYMYVPLTCNSQPKLLFPF